MPNDIAGFVWAVGGALIIVLFSIIGHFGVSWMRRHDSKVDQHDKDIADHTRQLAVMQAENKSVLDRVDEVIGKIDAHIKSEESFWVENRRLHKETQDRLLKMETRHELED